MTTTCTIIILEPTADHYFFSYLTSAVFKALMLVGLGKFLKQIIQIKHNGVKNHNWPGRGKSVAWLFIITSVVEDLNSGLLRTNPASGQAGLELGASEFQGQCSNRSAMLP